MPFNIGGIILNNTNTKLYNNRNIVRNDLVLYLDAGLTTSYPGSGTAWTDLSGNGNNFTLYNGVGYSTANGGCLTFDGTNDYVASNSNINLTPYNYVAIEVIYRSNVTTGAMLFEHTANWNTNTGGLGLYINSTGVAALVNSNHTNHNTEAARNYLVTDNTAWNNNFNLFGRISDSTGRLTYTEGLLTSFITGPGYPTDTTTIAGGQFANAIFYMGTRGGSTDFFNGRISSLKVYGFKITAPQVLQNFYSSRQKFVSTATAPAIIVGGTFTTFNGQTHNRIIRLSPNGSVDTSFVTGTGFDNTVVAWGRSVQSDRKVIVGHNFTTYNGTSSLRLARLNSNGSYDSSFNVGTGFDNTTPSISLQSDGRVVIGGAFTTYRGTSAPRIVRLNTDGSIDTGFVYGSGFNGTTENLAIDGSSRIIAVGGFTSYNGTSAARIARLNTNGTIDGTFNTGTGFPNNPTRVIVDSSSRIVVVGFFVAYNGSSSSRIVRINSDGTIDSGFSTGTGFNNVTRSVAQQSDGKLVVGGIFTAYNGTTANRIVRLNSDGSIDSSFNTGTGFSAGTVWDIAVQPDGKIIAVGNFTSYNGTTANRIIRLNSDGSIDSSFNPGTGFGNNVAFWVQFVTL